MYSTKTHIYILSFFYHLLSYLKNLILMVRIIEIACTFFLLLSLCRPTNSVKALKAN